ncbi:hypothetical protein TEA_022695 [Camellia sinensis var. sinensis]|uniref:beta-ketoacyl-[acyl-carrier-protein] synthase I n=1 Tax=Camellia sinensis var. sinensis TaxID=542762 RepID=A0A4S4ETJ8_CAMSN|nr:hypothetical protein TEA_022695 [Camellia sinensis var. sinensis]
MAASSVVCTWLVAACMSVACEKDQQQQPMMMMMNQSSSKRFSRWARKRRVLSKCRAGCSEIPKGRLISSGIQGLMSSYLPFEPCDEYYSSKGLCSSDFFGDNGFSSLFGSTNVPLSRRQRRFNRAVQSGEAMAVAVRPAKEVTARKKPPTKQRRVVVTGMGVETPVGHDPDVFYHNLLEGVSGISEIEAFDCAQYPTRIAGEIKSYSTDGWVAPKLSKRMDKFMLYMLTAGKKALEDGGITEDVMNELDKTKCGVLIGSAMGGMKVFNDAIEALRVSYRKMNPFCVPFATTNMGSAMLAMDLGWMGPNYSISTACATSNFCILNAANHIVRGEADMMLCGGSDAAIIPIGLGGFVACRALSQRNSDPSKASRPWDIVIFNIPCSFLSISFIQLLSRSAIEMLQAELSESACNLDFSLAENGYSNQQTTPACDLIKQGIDIIMLCSAVKLFRGGKKDTTIGEGLLKLGQSREDKLRRVTLKVDEADVAFALQGIRVFRNCLNACQSAIEMLQAELRESACNLDFSLAENGYSNQQTTPACDLIKQGIDIVRVDHMAIALSKTYRSPIMDTIQSLPQHQQNRDGFVMGEGAGVLLLEELEHAKERGANIYAEFLGGSFTCDAYHMTEPHPEGTGVILCIEKALAQSGVSKEDVNYINAHATSTPAGDLKEYQALIRCFGQNSELRVNSTKSMIGHLLGAAGAVEAVATVQAIRTGWVHPNINLENPDKGVDTNVLVGPKKERLDIKVALSNSFGFGGHNSSILFAPYK